MNPTNTPALETQRLILRKFTEDDLEDVYLIYSDREANAFLPWFPLETRDEAKALFEARYAAQYALPQAYAYAICLKAEGRAIGSVTSGTMSPTLKKGIGMGYVETAYAEPGTPIAVVIREKPVAARIVKLPFIPNR